MGTAQRLEQCGRAQRRKARFTQSDVTKALRGAMLAGTKVHGMSIETDGRMTIHFDGVRAEGHKTNSWDEVLS